ncbi:hypothetical protein DND132_2450 [Pseudodesulfovibrio mercurii]|uniref:Uncharacterized protein n=1 Tax=Pseudodesulfovibrio mercurii TaxID=641491 RepID=F0JC80_9BACT|nr:hypothetical protein [Pseudodesulfovibrio mercurii]EGB15653.1 hypothetical protein DND132_2450 [Pseudodesulfovibrio mercurii]
MIISGAQMNYGFMHKLKTRQDQGDDLGSASSLLDDMPGRRLGQLAVINPAKDGLTPAVTALANAPGQVKKQADDQSLGETFANEIIRRMGEVTDENGETRDTDGLRDELASTMDWLRERFGNDTAAAAAGMIIQATSSGVNEDTLGNGLLNVLKFIDRNFGTNAGDAAIAEFNAGINTALNAFFDNGQNEIFYVAGSAESSATQDNSAALLAQAADADGADPLDEFGDILDQLRNELDNIAQLQDLTSQLEEQFNPAKASVGQALEAYQAAPGDSSPQLTSVTV